MKNNIRMSAFLLLLVLSLSSVYAATMSVSITSQPSTLPANNNYVLGFSVTDTANNTANVTAKLYVNAVNVVNTTWIANSTTPGSNTYATTFSESYYSEDDSVYVNVSSKEAGNNSVTASALTNTITINPSTTSVLAKNTFSGLPSLGTNLSGFFSGISGGVISFLLLLAVIGGVIVIFYAVGDSVKKAIGKGK